MKAKENTRPTPQWSPGINTIDSAVCTALATVALPRGREHSELGYLHCFLLDTLIEIMVSSTTEYAQTRGATPAFVTDAAEMWRFMTSRVQSIQVRVVRCAPVRRRLLQALQCSPGIW